MEESFRYKIELHAHTVDSSPCSNFDSFELAELYKEIGYSAVVVTDHFLYYPTTMGCKSFFYYENYHDYVKRSQRGYTLALKRGNEIGFKIYYGIELRIVDSYNDYLVYGLTPEIMYNEDMYEVFKKSLDDLSQLKEKYGLAIFQAHPTRSRGKCVPRYSDTLDGYEVYNKSSNNVDETENEQARVLCEQQHKVAIGGSDVHNKKYLGRGGIIARYLPEDEKALAKMLKEGKDFITIK